VFTSEESGTDRQSTLQIAAVTIFITCFNIMIPCIFATKRIYVMSYTKIKVKRGKAQRVPGG
jgi:hypothetical protein